MTGWRHRLNKAWCLLTGGRLGIRQIPFRQRLGEAWQQIIWPWGLKCKHCHSTGPYPGYVSYDSRTCCFCDDCDWEFEL